MKINKFVNQCKKGFKRSYFVAFRTFLHFVIKETLDGERVAVQRKCIVAIWRWFGNDCESLETVWRFRPRDLMPNVDAVEESLTEHLLNACAVTFTMSSKWFKMYSPYCQAYVSLEVCWTPHLLLPNRHFACSPADGFFQCVWISGTSIRLSCWTSSGGSLLPERVDKAKLAQTGTCWTSPRAVCCQSVMAIFW